MSKKLIVALALSLVLVSGGLFSAQVDCGLNASCRQSNSYPRMIDLYNTLLEKKYA
ncbi:MAG TPA: hypothetical protein HPP57_05085 [Deltaproteobacteria bacterium]|jgi:hypothetical protein|nr:hypothetical protein [Deltaproteobacteria bacterium]